MSLLKTVLRNVTGMRPSPREVPPAAPAVAGSPSQPSPDRMWSLDTTPPMDFEPGFDLDWPRATLTDIADHFRTDKGNIKHRYTEVYANYFEPMRGSALSLLEIGVACGTSLKTWARYFPKAQVTGVDIRPECAKLCSAYPQIRIVIGDATKIDIQGDFDIVIDDGSHVSGDIVQAFDRLWPRVKPGGFYVVEDLGCTHDDNYRRHFTFEKDADAFDRAHFMRMVDAKLRAMDARATDIEFMHFSRQLCVMRKAQG